MAADLSVIVPGRKEEFHAQTVKTILANIRGNTEVIAVCDEVWPEPPIEVASNVIVLHFPTPAGQRGAVNMGARVSRAKYIMKLDAHSSVDEGFDVKLMAPYEDGRLSWDTTTIPRMYNLHAFDWTCDDCGWRIYQGPYPQECGKCKKKAFHKTIVWQPRLNRVTDIARFDHEMHFQYWLKADRAQRKEGDFQDCMSSVGACFFMRRDRFWALGGLDEATGSWGQFGTEVSCKSWLSGGRQVSNKTTWFSHMFRTNSGFTFPYEISGNAQERAKRYSRKLWLNNAWPLQTRPLCWLVQKFAPVQAWHEDVGKESLARIRELGQPYCKRCEYHGHCTNGNGHGG